MKNKVKQAYDRLSVRYEHEDEKYNVYNNYYERPAMIKQLPDNLKGLKVLDAGSAAGWYTEYLINQGAIPTAIDISPEMVAATKRRTKEKAEVLCWDLAEKLPFKDNTFDIIISSLTLHYLKDWDNTFFEFSRVLKPNGIFLYSVHHPIMDISISETKKYLETELLTDHWKYGNEKIEVVFYRRPLHQIINTTLKSFYLEELIEPSPREELKKKMPDSYYQLLQRPNFLIVKSINSKKK
ncbi:ubiquinone biosynthesis methyltransferase UbiE [Vulcanibacillus modesticaldus]|uniref:Ubiquinone biosynthesis methyltransferase UbiE n=1 Tax=Vulcanibacillus modesticaldus TaxID=337097 RepID=A0A1D2YW01_9BACI|nr:class I SAM-dependent methyltransferase [Vulcanibacillus modesticaldus]OEF99904.1 ubiquinone biosynthesis methyltransferase UbiE [Vulcanibacillus modesticaldus]